MAAGYQELFIEQGADFSLTITIDDVYGDNFDLTGFTPKSQIRKSYYSSNASAQFQITTSNPTNGSITLNLNAANTANLSAGRYVYDVVIKDSANTVTRVLEGIVNVLPRVTVF